MKTISYYECPICGKYKFNKEGDYDICKYCGWENDPVMNADPTYRGGANDLCQIDFQLRYKYYVKRNPKYHWALHGYPEIPQIEKCVCPVCGKYEFEDDACYDICPFCGWEDDGVQLSDPDFEGGANELSLKQYRKEYQEKIKLR